MTDLIHKKNMNEELQKKGLAADVPAPPSEPEDTATPVLRPEDEALVAERLRELGYIE